VPTNVEDIIKKLPPAQRKKVEARATELIAEEMTLRELRHARKLTQVKMAKKLGKWGHPRGATGWYGFSVNSLKSTTCRFHSAQSYRPNAFFANNENFLLQNTLMYEGQYRTLSGTSRGVADFNF